MSSVQSSKRYSPNKRIMRFEGDIIITDPCYIMKSDNDWHESEFGEDLAAIGIGTHLTCDSIECDCEVVNTRTGDVIGTFCSDSRMISVMLISEVRAYNPDFDRSLDHDAYTVIEGFEGEVDISECEDYDGAHVVITGRGNINFRTGHAKK